MKIKHINTNKTLVRHWFKWYVVTAAGQWIRVKEDKQNA